MARDLYIDSLPVGITTWVTHPSYQHDIVQARPILKIVLLFRFDNFRFMIHILSYTMSFVHQPDVFLRPTQKNAPPQKKKKKKKIPTNTRAPLFHRGQFDIIIETRVVCCPYDVRPFAVAMFVFLLKTASLMGPTCYDFYDLRETNISPFNGSNKRQTILRWVTTKKQRWCQFLENLHKYSLKYIGFNHAKQIMGYHAWFWDILTYITHEIETKPHIITHLG